MSIAMPEFLALGQWIDQARRDPDLRRWATNAMTRYSARSYVEAAGFLADPFMPALRAGDSSAKVLLAAAAAAAELPVSLGGLSFYFPDQVDDFDVSILSGRDWVPLWQTCPGGRCLSRYDLRFLSCRRGAEPCGCQLGGA